MKHRITLPLLLTATALMFSCTTVHNDTSNVSVNVDDKETYVIDESHRLIAGNFTTEKGTTIHFDEYGVDENPSSGLIEIAGFGSICLQTFIDRIYAVRVYSDGEGEYDITAGPTPNSNQYFNRSFKEDGEMFLKNNSQNATLLYFSIFNRKETPLKIKKIEIEYEVVSTDKALKQALNNIRDVDETFDWGRKFNPYSNNSIDPSIIPSNRKVVQIMKESEYPAAPGSYLFGYEVYDTDSAGNARKLLYTKTATLNITGENIRYMDGRQICTFHIPGENGEDKLYYVQGHYGEFDLSSLPEECKTYNWDSPYNDDLYIRNDPHFYPVFNVVGASSSKDGDGCEPVSFTYSYQERGFSMPNPIMEPGYVFGGWYLDRECTMLFDESLPQSGNVTLYAKCIESDTDAKRVYYHKADGSLINRVDYLYDDGSKLMLPSVSDIASEYKEDPSPTYRFNAIVGSSHLGIYKDTYKQNGVVTIEGDKISYDDFKDYDEDIHMYIGDVIKHMEDITTFDFIRKDVEGNNLFLHALTPSTYSAETDFSIPSHDIPYNNWEYDDSKAEKIERTGQFFCTDEKKAYIYDSGTLGGIASYGYANAEMEKPLYGILRHESARKVGRRAFFNRYGLKGTYFPKYAVEFDIEAYANTRFNGLLSLPKTLTKIGDRCFIGSEGISVVCLPKTLKTVGTDAFSRGRYNVTTRSFEGIYPRAKSLIFIYEGSEKDFNALDESTKNEIQQSARKIYFNQDYNTYYGK